MVHGLHVRYVASGRRIKTLTMIRDFSKVFPGIMADASIPSRKITTYLIRLGCYTAILSGYTRITVQNLPVQSFSFISGQKFGTLSLSILGRENLPIMRSLKVSVVNLAMSV